MATTVRLLTDNILSGVPYKAGDLVLIDDATANIMVTSGVADNNANAISRAVIEGEIVQNPQIDSLNYGKSEQPLGHYSKTIFDVVVYGATFSGCMAAISAKRQGASVLLINPRDDVGGMVTGGIQYTDATGGQKNKQTIKGLTNKFYRLCCDEYGLVQQTHYNASYPVESHVAQRVLNRMLADAGIQPILNNKLTTLTKLGAVVASLTFDGIGQVLIKTWVDATYTGDLIAMAGCSHTIGREAALYYANETTARCVGTCILGTQPTNPIDPYITPGDPGSGLIAFVQPEALKTIGSAEPTVQAMGLRLSLTSDAGGKIAFSNTPPPNYSAANYEVLARDMAANPTAFTSITSVLRFQATMPGRWTSKQDANQKSMLSIDYPHPESTEYITASWERRAVIEENIKNHVLGLIYWIRQSGDSRIPSAVVTSFNTYGWSIDEYVTNGGIPPYAYVREGRRLIGDFVLTGTALISANSYADPIAEAYYPMDSHFVQFLVNNGRVVGEGATNGSTSAAVGNAIPMRVIFPKVEEVTNGVAAWCISVSRLNWLSVRVEPVLGAIGEAAGAVAAMAAMNGTKVQDTYYKDLVKAIDYNGYNNYGGATISPDGTFTSGNFTGVMTNATYKDGSFSSTGTWQFNSFVGQGTSGSASSTTIGSTGTFSITPKKSGMHDIYIRWAESNATTRGSPTFTVTANGTTVLTTTVDLNCTTGEGGDWYHLGCHYLRKGGTNTVVITINDALSNNFTALKAIPNKS